MLARAAGPQRMGRVMSVVAVPALLGPVLGPVIGGLIVDAISWRWIFYVNLPVGAIALLAAWRWLEPDEHRRPDAPIDRVGVALLSPGLAAFVYGVSEAANVGLGGTRAVLGMALGAALIAAFVLHALRARHPLLDMRLFADRVFAASSVAMVLFAGTMFAVMLLFPLYEQAARGLSALDAGLLMAPQGLAAMVAMPVAGKLSDLRGPRALVLFGVAATLIGTIAFTQVSADSEPGAAGAVAGRARDWDGVHHGAADGRGLPHAVHRRRRAGDDDDEHRHARRRRGRHRGVRCAAPAPAQRRPGRGGGARLRCHLLVELRRHRARGPRRARAPAWRRRADGGRATPAGRRPRAPAAPPCGAGRRCSR